MIASALPTDARFWNRIAEKYARKPVADQAAYEAKLAKTNEYLRPTDRVLELGCGTGTTAVHHAPNVAQLVASDISERMIHIAQNKARQAGVSNVDFEVASVESMVNTESTFNAVLAHSVLHLLREPEAAIHAVNRRLTPDGVFIATTACVLDFMPWFRFAAPIGRTLRVFPYVNIFGEADLLRWFAGAGFNIEHRWQPSPKSGVYLVARRAA
ncbi:MAG: methyltransferase domain-containing protein [Pseudomonadota bacterium]